MERAFAKLPLFVAYYRRAYPRFVKLKQDLAAGRLGTIQSVSYVFSRRPAPPRAGDWRLDAERSGGGKFVDIGSHALDLIDFLLGPLDRVRASATGPAGHVETKVEMHFRVGNVDGTATWNFEEIPMHIRATARTGASARDVAEAFQHVAVYAGVPKANHALKIAKSVFAEMEAEENQ